VIGRPAPAVEPDDPAAIPPNCGRGNLKEEKMNGDTIEIERPPAKFPYLTLDDIDTIDTEDRCHVLKECSGSVAVCGAEIKPWKDCYVGCRKCIVGHEVIEVCPDCGRLICDGCRDEVKP
jgi:hypothetical protein